ncbi:MAG: efflux RND transporter periplasmic adaptor subunit [Desulfuromonadales bacterium]|nr:efflux RND transporter periplasmic adaptor subunit [Desulfuromonadales bacterium]
MKPLTIKITAIICFILSFIACSNKGRESTQAEKPPVAVETAIAKPSQMTEKVNVTGTLDAKFKVDVRTQMSGLVKQVYVTEWVHVKKGQPLAAIDSSEAQAITNRSEASVESARASYAQAQVELNRSERERSRTLKLKEAGLATQQAVDDSKTEVDAAKARLEAANAQIGVAKGDLRQSRTKLARGLVVSPIDGVVAMRDVNVGDFAGDVSTGKTIFRIVDNRLLELTVTVPSPEASKIKVGQILEFSVDALPDKTFRGKVMFINPEISSTDRSLSVIAEVQNVPEQLKGGMFATGKIITDSRHDVLLIPRNAITDFDMGAGRGTVFVIENGIARKREITTGEISGDMIEVKSGISSGERYVTRGGFNLKDGDKVTDSAGGRR